MDLILLRHGKAEDFNSGGDESRMLVDRGREQARSAARLLMASGGLPELVLTSPLVRARQTAEEFCTAANLPGPVEQGWLACGMVPANAMVELGAFKQFKTIAIVGHEPDFSLMVEWLLGVKGGMVDFKKGALACIRIAASSRYGKLRYLVPPKLADEF